MLVAGSVIIGRREEGVKSDTETTISDGNEPLLQRDGGDGTGFRDSEDNDTQQEVELLSVKSSDEEIESQSEDDDGTLK